MDNNSYRRSLIMPRIAKAFWIIILLTISLACSLPITIKSAASNPANTQAAPPAQGAQPPAQAKATQPSSQSNPTTALIYSTVNVRTEVSTPGNPLSITKYYAYYDAETIAARVMVIVENTSTDALDIITEYTGKVSWFDDKNQVIDTLPVNMIFTNIFPQEKQLFESFLQKSKITDRKISLVRVEVAKVATVRSFGDSAFKDKISKQKWGHPFATPKQVSFEVKPFMMGSSTPMGTSKVTVQNNMNSKFNPRVVGLYYNAKNELVGVGKSAAFELPALGSANADVMALYLSAEPVKVDYFVEMPATKDITDMMNILAP
jgi:hypothetical protein